MSVCLKILPFFLSGSSLIRFKALSLNAMARIPKTDPVIKAIGFDKRMINKNPIKLPTKSVMVNPSFFNELGG